MNRNHIIGVDGGNSKTDYFLFDLQGIWWITSTLAHVVMSNFPTPMQAHSVS